MNPQAEPDMGSTLFQSQRLGVVLEPDPGNPLEAGGVDLKVSGAWRLTGVRHFLKKLRGVRGSAELHWMNASHGA
ncbi:MAG: hypothetical protein NTV80_20850 [Verrucomicrobia bacterium]|nr:hypothetical protein [Verrucomicrobiota bacterium]